MFKTISLGKKLTTALVALGLMGLGVNLAHADSTTSSTSTPASTTNPAASDIVIDQAILINYRVGIADFSYQGVDLPLGTIEGIIANDLKTTGKFEPIGSRSLPQPMTESLNPQLWSEQNVPFLITGQITGLANNQIKIDYSLFDMNGLMCPIGVACATKSYTLPKSEVRQLAHLVASNVFKKFFKVDGGFTSKIAYVQQPIASVEKYNLYISDWDGANSKVVYSSNRPILSANFSPDGNNLVFTNYSLFSAEIKNYNLNTGRVNTLIKDLGNNNAPAYSPDGKYLAYSRGNDGAFDIYLYNLQTRAKTNLTHGVGRNTEPSWFGNTILFTSDRGGVAQIYQMSQTGTGVQRVSRTSGQTTDAQVTSNGKYLVMINKDRLLTQEIATGKTNYITSSFLDQELSLTQNGYNAIYTATSGSKSRLFIVSLDGIYNREIPTAPGVITSPAWQQTPKYLSE